MTYSIDGATYSTLLEYLLNVAAATYSVTVKMLQVVFVQLV
jgi:hypothetical protein